MPSGCWVQPGCPATVREGVGAWSCPGGSAVVCPASGKGLGQVPGALGSASSFLLSPFPWPRSQEPWGPPRPSLRPLSSPGKMLPACQQGLPVSHGQGQAAEAQKACCSQGRGFFCFGLALWLLQIKQFYLVPRACTSVGRESPRRELSTGSCCSAGLGREGAGPAGRLGSG